MISKHTDISMCEAQAEGQGTEMTEYVVIGTARTHGGSSEAL
jgi:hypothetical protein